MSKKLTEREAAEIRYLGDVLGWGSKFTVNRGPYRISAGAARSIHRGETWADIDPIRPDWLPEDVGPEEVES